MTSIRDDAYHSSSRYWIIINLGADLRANLFPPGAARDNSLPPKSAALAATAAASALETEALGLCRGISP